jgi:RNA polymerase sigma-70 factor (ECF subfamily)
MTAIRSVLDPRQASYCGAVGRLVELARMQIMDGERAGLAELAGALTAALEPVLDERLARARAAWPGLAVDDATVVRAIVARLAGTPAPAAALAAMQTDDLYLALACAAGEPPALAYFEQHCGAAIERALATTRATPADRADLGQVVRQRLLVAPAAGGPPRIASYAARGALAAWVRVVATREAVRALPRARREPAAEDDELAGLIARDDDPEVGYLKRLYRAEFKRAFRAAVEQLEPRERLVLRQHVLDRLGIDQLAAQHDVHRATAARWIQAARDAVLAGTQRELIRRLQLSRGELASVMRLIDSQLDVSLPRVLGEP